MNLAALKKSRALWLAREKYRLARWRWYRYRSKRPTAERMALRRKWWGLYEEAREQRVNRDRQIAQGARAISRRGIDFIMREEGVVLDPYNDPAGYATIGVGHLLHLGAVTPADRIAWRGFTLDGALRLLDADLDRFEKTVREAVTARLEQWEFDALTSLSFNIGETGFRESTVVRRLNDGDRTGAADAMRMWDKPAMLKPRRERERALFLTGRYE